MYVLMRPSGTSRIRKESSALCGGELNEYDRVSLVPGTCRFTYWPGRNASGWSECRENVTVVGESRPIFFRRPPNVLTSALHAADDAGTLITQSDCGFIWQVSTKPWDASSSVSASSMYSPIWYLPLSQWHLQVPQAPSRQSSGMLIFTL